MRVVTKKESTPGYVCDLCGRLRDPEEVYGFKQNMLWGDIGEMGECKRHLCHLCVHVIVRDCGLEIWGGSDDSRG
jgi:hypothetical protein